MSSRALKNRVGTGVSQKKTGVMIVLSVFFACIMAGCVGVVSLASSWLQDIPDFTDVEQYNSAAPTIVYAADGTTVLAEFQMVNREPVTLDRISQYVLEGTVATEDERFYTHNGIDMMGIARALANNLLGGQLEGASTITQQFVRNTILAEEMTDISYERKVREAYVALKLEEAYSKSEILLMYLNTINYGSGAYGIQAASERYFSKSADELTLNEAATLIGIPQSPTYNNPIDNPENCLKRRNVVLDRMVSNNVITAEEAAAVKEEPIVLNETKPSTTGILRDPFFVTYVRSQLMSANGKYGYSTDELFKGGMTIYTTLDVEVQAAAERAAAEKEEQAGEPFEVSMVAIDPDNGFIRAMIGGKDYNQTQVNMATGEGGSGRQCGSAFKIFTLAAAIEKGINPNTNIDAGKEVSFTGWDVHNNANADYGTTTISRAFAVSSNTAFARLCMSIGPSTVADMAHRLGITSTLTTNGSITLGTSLVNQVEMADAVATLANGGTHYDPECIERIVDRNGNVIVDNSDPEGERVITEEVAAATIDVMKLVITSGTGTSAALANGQVAAGKTGTTDDNKDSYFCGVTPQYAVAIWLGDRADITKAKALPPYVTAASVFSSFLNQVLEGKPLENFPSAGKPDYSSYYDADNHIGSGSYWSSDSYDDDDEGDDEEIDDENENGGNTGTENPSGGGTENPGGTEPENPGTTEPPVVEPPVVEPPVVDPPVVDPPAPDPGGTEEG